MIEGVALPMGINFHHHKQILIRERERERERERDGGGGEILTKYKCEKEYIEIYEKKTYQGKKNIHHRAKVF